MNMESVGEFSFLKYLVVILMLFGLFSGVSATEIESGYIQATSTGIITEDIGFRPDYIEFVSAQQVESVDSEFSTSSNDNCPDNVNGWSEGSALFSSEGTSSSDVDKQFTIGAFRNSDSTNDHRVASSTSDVIKNVYTGRNGGSCGELRISVTRPTGTGFELDVESKYGQFDEIVRYKAYQFPDNMEFDAGMKKVDSTGSDSVSTGFQPANIHIRAGQQISSKNIDTQFEDNDPEGDNTLGRSKGYATMDSDGNVIDQQSIGTASSSDSTNAHRSIASDEYILNTAYVGQDGNLLDSSEPSRLRAKITGADPSGFDIQVDDKWSGTDDIFLYRAWGFSYYDFQIGYDSVSSEGIRAFNTGFEPDAIDIYAEQQISSINNEVVTSSNSGCDNAGGWSNGYYEADDDSQWSLSAGRSSDSQNAHRIGSSTNYALNNVYSGQSGSDCGNFQGEVTGTSSTGFEMDFSYDSNFEDNYGDEIVYFRALNFLTAPPSVESIEFYNSTDNHRFGVVANVSEGSNDISSCQITAEDGSGNSESYSGTATAINSTWSQCRYQWITYDDNGNWETKHDQDDRLLTLDVTVEASDIDGLSSESTASNRFPNNRPEVESFSFSNYSSFHGFSTATVLKNTDSVSSEEIEECELVFTDGEGNKVTRNPVVDRSFGGSQESKCFFDNVNSSMPLPSGESLGQGFEVLEEINVEATVTDHHGNSGSSTSSNTIPNTPPIAVNPEPGDGGFVSEFPVDLAGTLTDQQGDEINATIYGEGSVVETFQSITDGSRISNQWDVPDATNEDYSWKIETSDYWQKRNTTFSFTKIIGQNFRTRTSTDLNYSSLIMNAGSNKYAELTIRNQVSNEKNLTISLSGVEAEFLDGSDTKKLPNFGGMSQETFTIRVNPDEPVSGTLGINVRNNNLNINTTESFSVRAVESVTQSNREVPGIGLMQLVFLFSAATVLYSVRL